MNITEITYHTFVPGIVNPPASAAAGQALCEYMKNESPERSYSQMMRYRLSGCAAGECVDRYFIAMQGSQYIARLWHGWGKQKDAIGNFGNFATCEEFQKQGIGRKLLTMWFEDIQNRSEPPLGLFCTSKMHLLDLYRRYGFVSAMRDASQPAPLYKPCKSTAKTFQEFCEDYYTETKHLRIRRGTVSDRHEIDCLLKFAFCDHKKPFAWENMPGFEPAFLAANSGAGNMPEVITADNGHIVGWAYTPINGTRLIQLHWKYNAKDIEESL